MTQAFLDGLWVAAQPIVDLSTGEVIGYETLIRGRPGSAWPSPLLLFAEARRHGLEATLESRCRALGIAWGAQHLTGQQTLFLNIHGAYATLPIFAEGPSVPPTRMALEISEGENTLESAECLQQIERWRGEGYRIVIDDYGVGYAGLGLLLAIQPEIVKIDRLLIAGIDRHGARQSVLVHFRELALDQGITLLAEGIETEEELRVLQQIGIPLGQGYLLGRPGPDPVSTPPTGIVRLLPETSIALSILSMSPHGVEPSDQEILKKASEAAYATDFPSYVVTRTRHIVAWNEAAAAVTGWTRDQMENHRCRDQRLNHHDLDGQPLCVGACPLVWTMAKNHAHKQRVIGFGPEGARLALEVLATPLWNPVTHKMVGAIEYFWAVDSPGSTSVGERPELVRG